MIPNKSNLFLQKLYLHVFAVLCTGFCTTLNAQESPMEEDFFNIRNIRTPEGILLEVGGLCVLPNGNLGVATRRGEVYVIENPTSSNPFFRHFASGLHEPLGLAYKDGAFYAAQRGELTKLEDTNQDGKADLYKTVYSWPLSGHYHEYSFGPKIAPDGSFFVTGNVAFGSEQWWRGESRVPWRGWTMKISEDGTMEPWATGMRSPAGLGMIDGEFFYAENQGDWMGSGGIWKVNKGSFTGHPAGLRWSDKTSSPVDITTEQIYAKVDPMFNKDENGRYIKPENDQNEDFVSLYELKDDFPQLQTPAVWLPHGILGISNSEIVKIPEGSFGPFEGQLLVGDQGMSMIMRVFMEEVNGVHQGAALGFRSGFQSGVLRLAWAKDGSLFVGETNRGWGSAGEANQGLQRLVWNKRVPFEMKAVRAMPDGFEIEFTKPVDRKSATDLSSYSVDSFIYKYFPVYGSPPVKLKSHEIKGVKVSEDGMKVRIAVDSLRKSFVHQLSLFGVRADERSHSLVHPTAYYTLNAIPKGEQLDPADYSVSSSPAVKKEPSASKEKESSKSNKPTVASQEQEVPDYETVQALLQKNNCFACHAVDKKQVGPAYREVAKRNYSNEKILELIHNPQPANWPDYPVAMPPMPQVSKEDGLKIAAYINSLNNEAD
jgi:cytochrome c551/c552